MSDYHSQIAKNPNWRHQIELPDGSITPGFIDTAKEWNRLQLPAQFKDLRVLDIGCSDGYYSFRSESLGASDVVAIDDLSSLLWQKGGGFKIVQSILDSSVSFRELSVYDLHPEEVGTFDMVFFLNVIYHLKHPLLALEKIHSVMKPQALLIYKSYYSTNLQIKLFGKILRYQLGSQPLAKFYPTNELAGDYTNWWGPNIPCHRHMLQQSGFVIEQELYRSYDRIYYRAVKAE